MVENALAVESDALAYTRRAIVSLRVLLGRSDLHVRDLLQYLPDATAVYFRWRSLKEAAKTEAAASGRAAAQGDAGGAADEDEGDDVDISNVEALDSDDDPDGEDTPKQSFMPETDDPFDVPADPLDEDAAEEGLDGKAAERPTSPGGEEVEFIEDDVEDLTQIAILRARAEDELRLHAMPESLDDDSCPAEGRAASGSSAALGTGLYGTDVPTAAALVAPGAPGCADIRSARFVPPSASSAWAVFEERLRFFNERSGHMTAAEYAVFTKAREAGFLAAGAPRLAAAFVRRLGSGVRLSKSVLEVLGYLAFDRVCGVVEAALRIECDGQLTHVAGPISRGSYTAALAALPSLPAELEPRMRQVMEANQQDAVQRRLREAAAADALRHAALQEQTAGLREKWAMTVESLRTGGSSASSDASAVRTDIDVEEIRNQDTALADAIRRAGADTSQTPNRLLTGSTMSTDPTIPTGVLITATRLRSMPTFANVAGKQTRSSLAQGNKGVKKR
jgi:hypothetical protein